jgi:hypothetical protein
LGCARKEALPETSRSNQRPAATSIIPQSRDLGANLTLRFPGPAIQRRGAHGAVFRQCPRLPGLADVRAIRAAAVAASVRKRTQRIDVC